MTTPTTRSSFRTPERYGGLPQVLHWNLVLVVTLLLGVSATTLVPGIVQSKLRGLHQSLGLTLWVLGMLLLAWRVFGRAPGPESSRFSWQIAASRMVGVLLYGLLIVLPPLGYLAASLRGGGSSCWEAFPCPALLCRRGSIGSSGWRALIASWRGVSSPVSSSMSVSRSITTS